MTGQDKNKEEMNEHDSLKFQTSSQNVSVFFRL